MSDNINNAHRATMAAHVTDVFAEVSNHASCFSDVIQSQPQVDGDAYTQIQDLIGNLLHLADRHGWNTDDLISKAQANYREEVAEAVSEGVN